MLLDPDQAPRLQRPPPGDAADQAVALAERPQQLGRPRRHRRLLGPLGDRRQGAVDVGEDRRARRDRLAASPVRGGRRRPVSDSGDTALVSRHDGPDPELPSTGCSSWPRSAPSPGIFSGLFGVGGGTVIVPLLIFWFGYGERLATGTSLAAIVLIGLLGAFAQGGLYGNVHVLTGLLLSIPAVSASSSAPRSSSASRSGPSRCSLRRCWSRSRSS